MSNREAVCELPPLYASATVNLHVMRGPGEEYSGATRTAKTATIATSEQRNDSVTTPARKQQRLNNGAPPGDGFAFTSYEPHRPPFVSAIEPQTAQCGTRGLHATITGRDPPPSAMALCPARVLLLWQRRSPAVVVRRRNFAPTGTQTLMCLLQYRQSDRVVDAEFISSTEVLLYSRKHRVYTSNLRDARRVTRVHVATRRATRVHVAQVRCPLPAVETADEGYWLEREMYVAVTHNGELRYARNLHNEAAARETYMIGPAQASHSASRPLGSYTRAGAVQRP